MNYVSTRDVNKNRITASEAIVAGLAPDGGLYVPCDFPFLHNYMAKSYEQIAFEILRLYLTDFSDEELKEYIHLAYSEQLPVKVNGNYLELFHGCTLAFKDVALQLYPYLLTAALRKNNVKKTAVILVATSGDTGSAVIAGMADVPNTKAIVFYPDGGVSDIQKMQMTTQKGENINVFAIRGSFDDAQRAVKEVFEDKEFRAQFMDKYIFTSANSINLGRLLPQIAYYFYAYSKSGYQGMINYVVPTGNFGNILAGYYARKMGLPVNKLICATNSNRVLDDFFKTGTYDSSREFYQTISPSMDILVSSNLERLLYENGSLDMFDSDFATDTETLQTIKHVYDSKKYIIDPHTAVGQCVYEKYRKRTGDETPTMIVSTASPYKFPVTIKNAIGDVLNKPPKSIRELYDKPVLHDGVIAIEDIKKVIGGVLDEN